MCYQSSCSFSVIWRGDAHLSHSSLNPELSELIVLKLIWPSSGTFQHHHQRTSAAATVSARSAKQPAAPAFASNCEGVLGHS